jgi:hypothetical protein
MTDHLKDDNLLDQLSADAPVNRMRSRFDAVLARPPQRTRPAVAWTSLAAASILLVAGLLALSYRSQTPPTGIQAGDLEILELLEAPSTFDRLRGINAAAELSVLTPEVDLALLERLEEDTSVNVRLLALEVLLSRDVPQVVRERLPSTFTTQDTAIVQAHLGYQLIQRRVFSRDDLELIFEQQETFSETREALTRMEES